MFIALMIVWWGLLIAGWVVYFIRQQQMEFVPAPDDLRNADDDPLSEHVNASTLVIEAFRAQTDQDYSPTT